MQMQGRSIFNVPTYVVIVTTVQCIVLAGFGDFLNSLSHVEPKNQSGAR